MTTVLKKVHLRGSFYMSMQSSLGLLQLFGQASNAVVVAVGSPQTFSSIKAELTSAVSDIFEAEKFDAAEFCVDIIFRKVYAGDSELEDVSGDSSKSSLSPEKLLYSLEYAGNDLKLVMMAVPLRDTENENLLDYLGMCLDFVDKSRKEGSVLVHCFAGVSRSAAIITAYLMRTEQLSQEDALESLQKSCEFVCPNDGFLEQSDSYNRREGIDTSKFGADPGLPTEEASADVGISGNSRRVSSRAYRCKKCRRVVALQENIVDHVPGEGETSFGWHKRKGGNPFNKCDEVECSSIFVEPLRWMTTVRASFYVSIVKLAWVTSIGQASNAVVVAGSPRPFSSMKAESTSALSDLFQGRRGRSRGDVLSAWPSVQVIV
ncbi:unnamed protein product [Camellia sinensis]